MVSVRQNVMQTSVRIAIRRAVAANQRAVPAKPARTANAVIAMPAKTALTAIVSPSRVANCAALLVVAPAKPATMVNAGIATLTNVKFVPLVGALSRAGNATTADLALDVRNESAPHVRIASQKVASVYQNVHQHHATLKPKAAVLKTLSLISGVNRVIMGVAMLSVAVYLIQKVLASRAYAISTGQDKSYVAATMI
jgi:hypothetical protein